MYFENTDSNTLTAVKHLRARLFLVVFGQNEIIMADRINAKTTIMTDSSDEV